MSKTIALLTDFGADSHYVGQMKGKILAINPDANVVDITHSILPQNLTQGAYILRDSIEAFGDGTVFVVVIDPGVGTQRDIVVVDANHQKFVLPNNGLISRIARDFATTVAVIDQKKFSASGTFHGRDIMAPVAAKISNGEPLGSVQLASTIELILLDEDEPAVIEHHGFHQVSGSIVYSDRFGNLISNIRSDLLPSNLASCEVRFLNESVQGISYTYGEKSAGELMALIGSNGRLELAINQGSAERRFFRDFRKDKQKTRITVTFT